MLGRLILVVFAFFVASTFVRMVRAAFRRPPSSAGPAPPRTDLDPTKKVSANWSEVASDREGGTTD